MEKTNPVSSSRISQSIWAHEISVPFLSEVVVELQQSILVGGVLSECVVVVESPIVSPVP